MKDLVFVDTETTNLIGAMGNLLEFQPYIIEIYILRTNSKLEIIDEFNSLIKPPVPIPGFITKITGISDFDVVSSPKFKKVIKPIRKIMKGAGTFVAHNATFDFDMIVNEMTRWGSPFFQMPTNLYCTVEQSFHLKGYRLKNLELYELLTGKTIENQHRAKADTLATLENYKILKRC